jgi:hypothetical protein
MGFVALLQNNKIAVKIRIEKTVVGTVIIITCYRE